MEGNIIIADDDKSIRTVLGQALTRAGCRVKLTGTISTLWKWIEDGEGDVIIVDVMMPDGDTLDILPVLKRKRSNTPIIVMSAVNTVNTAVRAIDVGAFDYLAKPFDLSKLVSTVNLALKSRSSSNALSAKPESEWENFNYEETKTKIIGSSDVMQRLYKNVAKAVGSNYNVLINGSSGTGKTLLAKYIHDKGSQSDKIFKELTLGVYSKEDQLDAFNKLIQFVKSDLNSLGTIFFDEILNLNIESQSKLISLLDLIERFKESGKLKNKNLKVIASTSVNLEEKVSKGAFREDLYYRINGISLNIPRLNNRTEDIAELTQHFLNLEGFSETSFSSKAIDILQKQEWRGNVRELKNIILRTAATNPNMEISVKAITEVLELQPDFSTQEINIEKNQKNVQLSSTIEYHLRKYFGNHGQNLPAPGLYDRLLRELETPLIKVALEATKGNQLKASRLLGLNRNTLRKKIKDLNIEMNKRSKS